MQEQALVNLVSFRGPIGSGKTFSANYLVQSFGYRRVSFADALKLEVFDALWHGMDNGISLFEKAMHKAGTPLFVRYFPKPDTSMRGVSLYYVSDAEKLAWINANKTSIRSLLQWWGPEYRRSTDENYWVSQWSEKIAAILADGGHVVVDDARFDNEIDLIMRIGGIHIYIETDSVQRADRLAARDGITNLGIVGHASEGTSEETDDRNAVIIKNIAGSTPSYTELLGRSILYVSAMAEAQ